MTGKLFEYDFCGNVVDFWNEALTYIPWRKAVKYIKATFSENVDSNPYSWDVSDPDGICSDLFYYVAEALQVQHMTDLKVYPAFGSPLDVFHGVDLFFEYCGKICTVDLTINPNKDNYKANVIVNPETDLVWMGRHIASRLS